MAAGMAGAVTDRHRGAFEATASPWTPKAGPRAGNTCPATASARGWCCALA